MNRLFTSGHAASIQFTLRRSPQLPVSSSLVAVRHASLSAIHRGLRRSERIQYGSVRPREESPVEKSLKAGRRDDSRSERTARAMAGAASPRQQARLHKKLTRKERERLQEQQEDDGTGKQTRRKRFLNPERDFGKKSLVYQLQYGVLKNEVPIESLPQPVRPRPRDDVRPERSTFRNENRGIDRREPLPWENHRAGKPVSGNEFSSQDRPSGPRDAIRDPRSGRREPRQWETSRAGESSSGKAFSSQDRQSRPLEDLHAQRLGRENTRDNQAPRQRREGRSNAGDRPRESRTSQQSSSREVREKRLGGDRNSPEFSNAARKMMPMAIKYTTAASQFLYGRSVVKAALEQSRRKLYNLYVYGGENRIDSYYNQSMIRLAEKQRIPVTIVPNDQQRLMDKMSMGRPHNGFVLETSPLPQVPVTALGKLEESADKLGFYIERGHQTREEEAVNGTNTFIMRQSGRTPKPLVLLLHEILDPGNLGALLRTASYLGVDAVGITQRSSSTLTPVVLKSAAGAVEEITIFSVDSPAEFLEKSKSAGWAAYAAVAPPENKLAKRHGDKFVSTDDIEERSPLLEKPCILVLGNEGYGLPRQIKVAADYELSIPRIVTDSCIDSLNVSVAGALLSHAFIKGVNQKKSRDPFDSIKASRREGNEDKSDAVF
ncbi:hypothetical protein PWT90_04342 [Aphanocladium album]|nr:hypothetical protein PWT90_04342 [Aphanocladium album]